ncbi:MAG: hypothetical protein ACREQ4_09365, partial [Candidatus Binataceae bacterium]
MAYEERVSLGLCKRRRGLVIRLPPEKVRITRRSDQNISFPRSGSQSSSGKARFFTDRGYEAVTARL